MKKEVLVYLVPSYLNKIK